MCATMISFFVFGSSGVYLPMTLPFSLECFRFSDASRSAQIDHFNRYLSVREAESSIAFF